MSLSEVQVNDLARPLVGIITKFYADPKNEEDFQKWLRNVEEQKQKEYSFTNNGKTWERITKKQARAAYNNGLTVLFCPVNMRPFTPWHLEIDVNKNFEGYNGVSFEKAVNAFEIYNCTDNETGRYTAFYIPIREVDRFTGEAPTAYTLGTVKQYDCSVMEG